MKNIKAMLKGRFSGVISMLMVLILTIGLIGINYKNVSAAAVHIIPNSNIEAVKGMTPVILGGDNLISYEWNPAMTGMGNAYEYPTGTGKSFAVKANTVTGKMYSIREDNGLLVLKFSDVMRINKRAVNATITIKEIKIYKNKTSGVGNRDIYVSFMTLNPTNIWVGAGQGYENDDWVSKEVTFETSFTWADNGQNILTSIPMYQALNDVDSYYGEEGVLDEGWKGNSGYTKDIYTFDKCGLDINAETMTLSLSRDLNTVGDDIWTVSGALVPLQGGSTAEGGIISQTFYEYACATGILFYSPYDDRNMPTPTKQADNSKVYEPGDTIIWNIGQKVHTYQADIFSHYSSFTFTDVLPEEVIFESAKLYHNNMDVTADYGTLSYDSGNRTVKYTLSSDTLKNDDFYNGRTLRLEIQTKASNSTKNVITVTNSATTNVSDKNYSDLIQSTNEVLVKINPAFDITTEIDHGTITASKSGIKKGMSETVTWAPENGYYIYSVTVDDKPVEADGSYTFTDINADHEIIVTTRPYHQITTGIDNGVISERIVNIKDRESKIVSWTPKAGYYVSAVKIDGEIVYRGNTLNYPTSHEFSNIDANHHVLVETKKIPTLVITKEADKETYNVDDEIIYTITAKQTVEDAIATNVVIADQDKTKGLEFDLSTVKCSDENATIKKENGAFTVSLDELTYGNTVTITVKGKVTKSELVSSDIKNTVTIKSDQTDKISADKKVKVHYNIVTNVEHGTIDDSISDIKYGEKRIINFKPDEGFYLSEVKVDGKQEKITENMDSFTFSGIKDNHLIEVKYAPYFKVVGKIDYGTITDNRVDIKKGESHTVTWTPQNGRYVRKVTVNGTVFYDTDTVTKNYPVSYEFKDIQSDCEIIVETAPIPEETTVPETMTVEKVAPEETTTEEITQNEEITSKAVIGNSSSISPKTGDFRSFMTIIILLGTAVAMCVLSGWKYKECK